MGGWLSRFCRVVVCEQESNRRAARSAGRLWVILSTNTTGKGTGLCAAGPGERQCHQDPDTQRSWCRAPFSCMCGRLRRRFLDGLRLWKHSASKTGGGEGCVGRRGQEGEVWRSLPSWRRPGSLGWRPGRGLWHYHCSVRLITLPVYGVGQPSQESCELPWTAWARFLENSRSRIKGRETDGTRPGFSVYSKLSRDKRRSWQQLPPTNQNPSCLGQPNFVTAKISLLRDRIQLKKI